MAVCCLLPLYPQSTSSGKGAACCHEHFLRLLWKEGCWLNSVFIVEKLGQGPCFGRGDTVSEGHGEPALYPVVTPNTMFGT